MPALQWDRLLETCAKRQAGVVIVGGTSGYLRTDDGLRAFAVPPVEAPELRAMIDEMLRPAHEVEQVPGCRSVGVTYGPPVRRFRIDAVGDPEPVALFLTQLGPDDPPALRDGGGWHKGWTSEGAPLSWVDVLRTCGKVPYSSAVLAPGAPPIFWSETGFHPAHAPPLTAGKFATMLEQMMADPDYKTWERDGYTDVDIRFTYTGERFRILSFGGAPARLVIAIRLGTHAKTE
jgi:Tfp pilus assembly pilus retraction ATPase PilT